MGKLLSILFIAVVVALSLTAWFEYQRFMTQTLMTEERVLFTVEPGMNLRHISTQLTSQQLTDMPPEYLRAYGRITQQAQNIKAGEYELLPEMTLPEVLAVFVSGKVVMNSFTIIEGMTAKQLFTLIQAHPKIKHTLADMQPETVMAAIGKKELNAEGQFLPETYHFPTGTTDVEFLRRAHQQLQQQLEAAWQNKANDLPYNSPYEALTMASIIEKESAVADERPEIAGVFVRRLKLGMRLQTDPTVIYGMGDEYDGNIRRRDLRTDTPYNTYTRSGLTPTPICLPSLEAIRTAVNPAPGDTLYFVATGEEGRHIFSRTLDEHNNAVRRYQLKKK